MNWIPRKEYDNLLNQIDAETELDSFDLDYDEAIRDILDVKMISAGYYKISFQGTELGRVTKKHDRKWVLEVNGLREDGTSVYDEKEAKSLQNAIVRIFQIDLWK